MRGEVPEELVTELHAELPAGRAPPLERVK